MDEHLQGFPQEVFHLGSPLLLHRRPDGEASEGAALRTDSRGNEAAEEMQEEESQNETEASAYATIMSQQVVSNVFDEVTTGPQKSKESSDNDADEDAAYADDRRGEGDDTDEYGACDAPNGGDDTDGDDDVDDDDSGEDDDNDNDGYESTHLTFTHMGSCAA